MPKFHIAIIGLSRYNNIVKNRWLREIKLGNKNFAYRITHYCEDNVQYLKELYEKYLSRRNDFYINRPEDCATETESFKEYLARKEAEYILGETTESNAEQWSELAMIQDFIRFGYTSAPDFKWAMKGYNLGTEIKDIELIKSTITKNKNLLDGIITDDGKFYDAFGGHYILNSWLLLNGIDTSKAIRVGSCLSSIGVLFSDLDGYYSMDKDLEITPQQARAMINTYRLNSSRLKSSFQTVMFESCGMGFLKGSKEGVFRNNLDTLETEVAKINTNKDDYVGYQMNYFSASMLEKEIARRDREKRLMRF